VVVLRSVLCIIKVILLRLRFQVLTPFADQPISAFLKLGHTWSKHDVKFILEVFILSGSSLVGVCRSRPLLFELTVSKFAVDFVQLLKPKLSIFIYVKLLRRNLFLQVKNMRHLVFYTAFMYKIFFNWFDNIDVFVLKWIEFVYGIITIIWRVCFLALGRRWIVFDFIGL